VKKLFAFFQKVKLRQIMTIVLAGLVLFISTACNSGDVRGARPSNLPVQVGGANNPHKGGGDGYTNYKMSNDPKVNSEASHAQSNRADLQLISNQLIAATTSLDQNDSKLLYPGSEDISSSERANELQKKANEVAQQPQPVLTQTDPDAKLLEKTQKAFKDASGFLKDVADSTNERPELQRNPAKN
jgi:hypothetical protein